MFFCEIIGKVNRYIWVSCFLCSKCHKIDAEFNLFVCLKKSKPHSPYWGCLKNILLQNIFCSHNHVMNTHHLLTQINIVSQSQYVRFMSNNNNT